MGRRRGELDRAVQSDAVSLPFSSQTIKHYPEKKLQREHSYAPEIGTSFFDHAIALGRDARLPLRAKELAILAVASHFRAAYEVYAHAALARRCGLSEMQVESALAGREPQGVEPHERAAFRVALAMAQGRGPVGDGVWAEVAACFGREESAVLVSLVGAYCYIAVVLNAGDVPAPVEGRVTG